MSVKLDKAKAKALKIVSLKGIENSYDRYNQEAAYWTAVDCQIIIDSATVIAQINAAVRIFERYKFHLKH